MIPDAKAGLRPDMLPPNRRTARRAARKKRRGCVYARFSTRFKHSIEDQIRKCREWAAANDVEVDDRHVFADAAVSGKTHKRHAFRALLAALERDEVDVVVTFATNRLFRKLYRSLQFVEEEVVDRGKRCVFVAQNIDTAQDFWRQLLSTFATHDEMMVQALAGQVRAAHEGLLLKEWVWGTIPFGYARMAVEGQTTRLGKPRTAPWVDDELKGHVLQAFRWFTDDGRLSFAEIAHRLREAGVPPPPRAKKWTWRAVKYLLANRRYIGDWSYGWTESVWQNKAGYSRQRRRDEPRLARRVEALRIVPDDLFHAAQVRIAERAGRGGRPSHRGGPRVADPLVEVSRCPKHKRRLSVCGANGTQIACPVCRAGPAAERALYSSINRMTGRRLLCESLARHVRADDALVEQAVAAGLRQADGLREPPGGEQLAAIERELASLSGTIRFALANPGESETDRLEQQQVVAQLRARRAQVEARAAELKAQVPRRQDPPTADELRAILADFGNVLARSAGDAAEVERAVSVILALTGGELWLSQEGEARRKGGWLRGRFRLRVVDATLARAGCGSTGEPGHEVVVDFREPDDAERLADEAKALFDQRLLVKQIATVLSDRHGRPVGRNLVRAALDHWYGSRGLGRCPDGRTRRSSLETKHSVATLYQAIAPEVGRLAGEGLELQEIAARLGRDRNTVAQSLKHWRRSRGLAPIDGRTRRKELPRAPGA